MSMRRYALLAALTVAVSPLSAQAQSAGGAVPAYEPPPPIEAPARDGQMMERKAKDPGAAFGGDQGAVTSDFTQAYAKQGKPRLALYWNRQLGETLSDWYSDVRMVERSEGSSTMSGDFNLNQSGSSQTSTEVQRRARDQQRVAVTESFEWEFQDAFLTPFLEAGATIIDRAAMIRLTGADMAIGNERTVETRALQGKADYLMEILVSPNWKSTTGYELRARILDIKTGAIVATVNSKNLKEWNPEKAVQATNRGFVDPNDADDADESFGPQGEDKYRATAGGFQARRKPPKLSKIAQNLAYNTMSGLTRQWK